MKHLITSTLLITAASVILSGCATPQPTRVDTGGPGALTTMGLDMADLMDVASAVTQELLVHPSITQFEARNGRKPVLDVGVIENSTPHRIRIEQVTGRINQVLLNSGQVEFVAHGAGTVAANAERAFLEDKKLNLAHQADFLLEGVILQQIARQGNLQENTFTFQLDLSDAKTRRQVWIGNKDITMRGASTNRRGGIGW